MRAWAYLFLIGLMCGGFAVFPSVAKDDVSTLKAGFGAPPRGYSSMPLWVWNGVVTESKIVRDLEAFKEQGIHGAFIHPRPGLITEYLSKEWFDLWAFALQEAKARDMVLWIYDENSFPSGFGGGHVAAVMPESVAHPTAFRVERISGEMEGGHDYDFVVERNDVSRVSSGEVSETTPVRYGVTYLRETTNGWYGGSRYVDLILPGVTETFIEVTMAEMERRFGGDLGASIPGVFTDEPNIRAYPARDSLRFTPSLWEDFENRWGYDLKPHVFSLVEEVGNWRQVRYHYYKVLLDLFIERWSEPWYAYTQEKGLKWTGHYWEHGWPDPTHGGDNMAMYAYHQVPGIDMLFNNEDRRPDQFGNVRAIKELASVCNQLGRERALSETHGGSGWDLDFADMKRLNDWQFALGVNFLNQHLSFQTIKGRRKGDFPLSFSVHAPYWEDYGKVARYYHRLSFALTRGEQVNTTLILEPTTTAWMYTVPGKPSAHLDGLERTFRHLLDLMERLQLGYDLGSERILEDHGRAEGGRWIVGERSYDQVIFPAHFETMSRSTFEQLRSYLQGGGRVILCGVAPTLIEGAASPELDQLFREYASQVNALTTFNNGLRAETLNLPELTDPQFWPVDPLSFGGRVHHMRRELNDGQLIFWANFSAEAPARVEFQARGASVYGLNCETGMIEPWPYDTQGEMVQVSHELEPGGSFLCLIPYEAGDHLHPSRTPPTQWMEVKGETRVESMGPNVHVLDFVDLQIGDEAWSDIYFSTASSRAYELNGLSRYGRFGFNPWSVAVQYRTNVLNMQDQFAADSGFQVSYPFEFKDGFLPTSLKVAIEWAHLYDLSINGNRLSGAAEGGFLDDDFDVFEVGPYLVPGRNTVTLRITPMHIHAEIEPIYLMGDFSLQPMEPGFQLAPPGELGLGSWASQGRSFDFDTVRYTKTIDLAETSPIRVRLPDWYGAVARVLVDGQLMGRIGWKPHEFMLERPLEPGAHEISVEVVGTLRNLFGPFHRDTEKGFVTPWTWMIGPSEFPPGEAYRVLDYGLFEDFVVEVPVH